MAKGNTKGVLGAEGQFGRLRLVFWAFSEEITEKFWLLLFTWTANTLIPEPTVLVFDRKGQMLQSRLGWVDFGFRQKAILRSERSPR